jgi:hypothetical protein
MSAAHADVSIWVYSADGRMQESQSFKAISGMQQTPAV